MKFSFFSFVSVTAFVVAVTAAPALVSSNSTKRATAAPDAATITSLAPPLGFKAGLNPTGTGDCDGAVDDANGQPIKIPCACPPPQNEYISQLIANVQAGHAVHNPSVPVSFPTDNSAASRLARLNAASVTIQNLNGPGQGCPVVSTTFQSQQKAINDAAGVPSPAASGSSSSSELGKEPTGGPAGGTLDAATIEKLAPNLGFHSGVNPTGTGDCDGAVNGANGQPIKIPCSCPPAQNEYLSQLVANVQAGHAIKNPTVGVSYPLDDSPQSQSTRITAALITLQNLNGPGVGCPAVSTTLQAQQKALA